MRTRIGSLRVLLSSAAFVLPLALCLSACDGVDDPGAPADDAEAARAPDDQDYVDPPLSDVEVAAPEFVDEELEAPGFEHAAARDLTTPVDPSALCLWYSERASLNLYSYGNKLYGNVKLFSNCNYAYARTTVTDSNVAYWPRLVRTSMQYWNGSTWVTWGPVGGSWTSLPGTVWETTPTTFATGTYVRACGQIEGSSPSVADLDSTNYYCTSSWVISSST